MFIKNILRALNFHKEYEANSFDNLNAPRSLGITNWKLEIGNWKLEILTYLLVVTSFGALSTFAYFKLLPNQTLTEQQSEDGKPSVLASTTQELRGSLGINVPTNFNDNVFLKNDLEVTGSATFRNNVTIENSNLDLGTGTLTASNVLYSLTAGSGIGLTTGQTPTISNTGVLSLGGSVGALSLTAGSGISIDGLKISSSVTNPNTFKTITVGSDSFSAGSSTDTLELAAGTGITLATDTTNKKITITGVSVSGSGWTDGGTSVYPTTITDNVGIGTTTPSTTLDITGTLNTTGAVTFGSTLGVTGNTTLSTLGTTGNTTVGGNFNTPGAATVGASLKVAGTATISGSTVIAPTNDVTALTVRAGTGATGNILDLTNAAGTTSYLSVANNGSLTIGGSTLTNAGLLESSGAIHLTNAANTIVGTAIEGGWTLNSNTYTYRRPITVTNTSGSTLPKNYQITVTLSSAVSAHVYANTQTGSPYYDFRTAWDNSNSVTEIARNVTSYTSGNVTYSFQLQSNISASGSDTYYIYYSNSALSTIDAAYSSYTGNVQLDSADAITNWATGDTTNYPLTLETTVKNEGTGSVKTVGTTGVLSTLSTSGQGQLAAATKSAEAVVSTTGGTNYIYTLGGNTGSADINAVTKTTIDGSGNAGTPTAASQNALPQVLSGHTAVVNAGSTIDGGSGADGTLDLSLGNGAGGCTGEGLWWNATTSTCWIVSTIPGPDLGAAATTGSLSFQNAAGNQVIAVGGSTTTKIYDRTNNTVSAGPSIVTAAGDGSLSFQNAAGNQVIVVGGGSSVTKIYDRTNNTVSAGPSIAIGVGFGSLSFQNAAGNQVIVTGANLSSIVIYDRTNNTVSAGPDLGGGATAGSLSFQNADGNQVIIVGGGSTTKIYDRTNNTVSAGPDLGATATTGSLSFQNAAGNQVIVVGGGTITTKIYDRTNNTVSAGPDLEAPASSGSHSFQNAAGNQVIVVGWLKRTTKIYDRTNNTVSSDSNDIGTTINGGALSFENAAGEEVIVSGGLLTTTRIYKPKTTFNFTTVNIPSGTILSASGGALTTFNATGNVTVGGSITLDSKGSESGGGSGTGGKGPYYGSNIYNGSGGGGYGGGGGNGGGYGGSAAGAGGSTYSTEGVGSGGNSAYSNYYNTAGGVGGGGIKITSAGTISNSGTISANGGNGSQYGGGGGSGGFVSLTGSTVTNTGTIRANGGNGLGYTSENIVDPCGPDYTLYWGPGGGGGGGIVSLNGNTVTQGTTTAALGSGGAAGGGFSAGSNGSTGSSTATTITPSIYVVGGINGATPQTTVYKSTIDGSQNVGAFSTTSQGQLPVALYNHSTNIATVGSTKYLYVIGGNTGAADVTTVYKATIDNSRNIGAFSTTSQGQLGTALSQHASTLTTISSTNYIHVIGGISGSTAQTTVYKATIDGSANVGAFSASGQTALPIAIYDASAFTTSIGSTNYIYLVGGKNSAGNAVDTIYKGTLDASGNVTAWVQTGTVPATLSGTTSVTASTGGTNYFYLIGGNNVSPVATVYRASINDMSGYTATKTLSSAVNLTNKNHIQFDTYSSVTGSFMIFEISEDNSSWTQCADNANFTSGVFSISSANTWETKTCDISGVADASKNAILYLRFRVGTNQTSNITQYFDNIYAYMNAGTVANSNAVGGAVLGSANLNLNAQGSGGVQLNYDAASGQAGSGGLRVYDGGIGLLFSVNTTGTASVSGGLTFTGASSSAQFNILNGQNLTFKTSAGGDAGLTTRMTLLNSGQFGIGSGTPVGLFDVNGANTGKALVIFNETGGQNIIAASGSGTTRFVLTNGGLLGLGNSTPIGMLDVLSNLGTVPVASFSGNTSFAGLVVNNNSTTGDLFTASSSGLNRFVIKNNGYVGMGTATPSSQLTVTSADDNKIRVINTIAGGGTSITLQNVANTSAPIMEMQLIPSSVDLASYLRFNYVGQTTVVDILNIMASGRIGIGTTSPLGTLDVRGSLGTIPVASLSGQTSFAGLVVNNNSTTGDLFTASSSGLSRFTIANNGNITAGGTMTGLAGLTSSGTITFSGFTSNGGILYTNGSGVLSQLGSGTTGNCLIANTGAAASWGSCDGVASVNVWEVASGTAQLANTTLDLLVGGTSTASAKFAVLNVNGTGPATATISGNMIIMPTNGTAGNLGIGLTNPSYNIDTIVVSGQRGLNVTGTTSTASQSFYGAYNTLSYTGGSGSPGIIAGTRNDLSITGAASVNSRVYGNYNSLTIGADSNNAYGSYNTFNTGTFTSTNMYGYYNDFGTNVSTSQNGYGLYNLASPASSSNSTKTGVYNDFDNILNSTGFRNVFTAEQTSSILKGLINDFSNTAAVSGIGYTGVENNFTTTRGGSYYGVNTAITTTGFASTLYGVRNALIGPASGGVGSTTYGVYNDITNNGGGSTDLAYGVYTTLKTTGASTPKSYGLYVLDDTGTTVGTQYGAYFALNDADAAKNWAIYVEDSSANSYFGNNGIDWGSGGIADITLSRNVTGQLGITGAASLSANTSFAGLVVNNNNTTGDLFTASSSGMTRMVLKNNGNFGVGTATPSSALQVGDQGDGTVAVANAWNNFSDLRFKENVNTISDGLSKVMALNGVSFNWRNSGLPSIGFIAQDVEKVVPEIVNTDANGFKSLDYGKITPLLVNAIHEQQNQISSLSAKMDKLETINFLPFSSIATDSSMITIKDSLLVLGSTTTNDLSVANTLSVGNTLNITGNSINTIGTDLEIQSLKQGNISFMGGIAKIDTDGNITTTGDVTAKNITATGVLSATTVSIGSNDLPVYLSAVEVNASNSAGLLTLRGNQSQIKVNNLKITPKSLIFVTPKTTIGVPLFIKEQVAGQYFIVGIKQPQVVDTEFNYLIVN